MFGFLNLLNNNTITNEERINMHVNAAYANYNENFSNLVNIEDVNNLSINLIDYVNSQQQGRNTEDDLDSFISGNLGTRSNNSNIEFLFSIESNLNSRITHSFNGRNNLIDYKSELIENKFEKLKNKLNAFSNIKNNHIFLQKTFLDNFDKLSKIVNFISSGISEKTEKVKENSFENKLKREYYTNSGFLFNKVINYIDNNLTIEEDNFTLKNETFLSKEETISFNFINYEENSLLRKSLIVLEEDYPFRFVKPLKNTSNDIVIQSIINATRSLYTMSTNSLIDNYITDEKLSINYEEESLKNLTTEIDRFYIFDLIDVNADYFDPSSIYLSSSLRKKNIDFTQLKNTSESLSTINYLIPVAENRRKNIEVVNSIIPNELKTKNYNKFCIESNKYFVDSIYNIDFLNRDINYGFSNSYDFFKYLTKMTSFNNGRKGKWESYLGNNDWQRSKQEGRPVRVFGENVFDAVNTEEIVKCIYFKDLPMHTHNFIGFANNLRSSSAYKSTTNKEDVSYVEYDSANKVNDLKYKLEIDNLVKRTKVKFLENNNISVGMFKEVANNIRVSNNINKKKILSYSDSNEEKKSVISKNNDFYKLLFTKDPSGGITYSHTDIFTNHKINNEIYKGLDEFKKNDLSVNSERENVKNNFKDFLCYYYPKCRFFSSSKFFHGIKSDIIKDFETFKNRSNENINNKHATNQALYLNTFENSAIDENSKRIIARRFLKKSIMLDKNSNGSLNNAKMSDFVYKQDDILIENYSKSSKTSIRNYLNDIVNSSSNLKTIRRSVFSNTNIRNLADQSNYKMFTGLNTITDQENVLYFFKHSDQFNSQDEEFWSNFRTDLAQLMITSRGTFNHRDTVAIDEGVDNFVERMGYNIENDSEVISEKINSFARQYIDENFNSTRLSLTGKMHFNFFPFHFLEYDYVILGDANARDSLNFTYRRKEINNIKSIPTEVEGQFEYSPDKNRGLDITSSENIKIEIFPVFNDMKSLRQDPDLYKPSIIIEDLFDEMFVEGTISNSISKVIQQLLRLKISEYKTKHFQSEDNVDEFINTNENVLEDVIKILELYSKIYLFAFNRSQRELSIRFFKFVDASNISSSIHTTNIIKKWSIGSFSSNTLTANEVEEQLELQNPNGGEGVGPPLGPTRFDERSLFFGSSDYDRTVGAHGVFDIQKFSAETLTQTEAIKNRWTINGRIFNQNDDIDCFRSTLLSDFNLLNTSYRIENEENNSLKTTFTEFLNNVDESLKESDVLQAFNLDIINGCIDYQDKMLSKSRRELSSSIMFDKLKEIYPVNKVEEIEENFYDIFYINYLSKDLFKNLYINNKLQKNINEGIDNNLDYLKDSSYLDIFKDLEKNQLNNIAAIRDSSSISKISSNKTLLGFYNSNFYTFGLKKDQLENLTYKSLIKFKISIVDKFNLNHIYIPKTLIFSPLFTNTERFVSEDFPGMSDDNMLFYYQLNKNLQNRLNVVNYNDIIRNLQQYPEGDFFIKLIQNKLNLSIEESLIFYEHLIHCHVNSKKSNYIVENIYSINNLNKTNHDLNSKILEKFKNLSNKEFFNIFDIKKDKVFDNNDLISKSLFEANENNDIVYELVNYLSKIGETNDLYNNEYYETYTICVDPKEFFYLDSSNLNNSENFNPQKNTPKVISDEEKALFFKDMPNYNQYKYFQLSEEISVENFNVHIEVEII